jgi:hypothetical protein
VNQTSEVTNDGKATMNKDPMDPETIAAFLDGKLEGRERERVVSALAASPDLYDLVVEATAVRIEVPPPAERPFLVIPSGKRIARFFKTTVRPVPWPAAAATLAAAALAGVVFLGQALRSGPQALGLIADASWQRPGDPALGAGWSEITWPGKRGGQPSAAPTGTAFRAGVLQVNFLVAANRGESALVRTSAEALKDVLGNVDGGGPAAVMASTATIEAARRELTKELEGLFDDSPWYALGLWIGQARLSAQAGNVEFFAANSKATKELRRLRDRIEAHQATGGNVNAQATLGHLNTLLEQLNAGGFNGTTPISAALDSILDAATSLQ